MQPQDLLRWLKFEQQLAFQERKESQQFQAVKRPILPSCKDFMRGWSVIFALACCWTLPASRACLFGALSDGQRT